MLKKSPFSVGHPLSCCLYKGFSDFFNPTTLARPDKHLKQTFDGEPFLAPGMGKGASPTVVRKYAKATFSPQNNEYHYTKDPKYAKKDGGASVSASGGAREYVRGAVAQKKRTNTTGKTLLGG